MECSDKCRHWGRQSCVDMVASGRCNVESLSNKGRSVVSMDAAINPDSVLVKGKRLHQEDGTSDFGLGTNGAEAVRRFMAPFFKLRDNPDDLALIVTVAGGGNGSAFARSRGVTRQAVNKRLLRLAALHREFRYLVKRVDFSRVDTSRYTLHHRRWRVWRNPCQTDFFDVLFNKNNRASGVCAP